MSGLSLSTGLISGLDIAGLVDALALSQQRIIDRHTARAEEFEIKKAGIEALEANLLSMTTSLTSLKSKVTFEQFSVANSDDKQLKISAAKTALPGSYAFQAIQKAAAHQSLSRGFVDATTQKVGEGTLTISQGGFLDQSTLLESLNDGSGVRRGSIRITDRSGASADIDLSRALSVNDVLSAINNNVDISVTARVLDGQFLLEDETGETTTQLSVVDLNGGFTASDLGLRKSVASDTLAGDDVFQVTENFNLAQINDGNNLRLLTGAADMKITLTDGTNLEVNLDGSQTLKDVLSKINSHTKNTGKVEASLVDGRIVLTDNTSGSETFKVEDINSSTVVRQLGLDAAADGTVLTGNRLAAGMNSVLLRNLRGGQGIAELGEISVTDRTGQTATIDLSGAETLADVIEAINNATDDLTGEKMFLNATLNEQGNGLKITDTSGATDSPLIISDLAGSTLAADLSIAVSDEVDSVNSGSLAMRYVNEATSLSTYAPDGGAVQEGMFQITDSAGNVGVITITSAAKNVGDIIQRINANTAISVKAELNETGDGFVLIDEAGGPGSLKVEEFGDSTTTAADLRLLGESTTGTDGKQRISSRKATVVEIDADDTLNDVVTKLNQAGSMVSASTFNDGSTYNATRLSVTATSTGHAGRLLIDDGGLGLNFGTIVNGKNAILQVGSSAASGFLLTSATNSFDEVMTGIDVDIRNAGTQVVTVDITANTASAFEKIQQFVTTYNQFVDIGNELTKFNTETNERGILQGDSIVLRATSRLEQALVAQYGTEISSLSAIGIRMGEGGKLELDEDRVQAALTDDLNGVKDLFTKETTGFAAKMEAAIKTLTDITEGTFINEKNVLNSSVDRINERIEELTLLMESKKARLLNQFVAMENILSEIQSQQTAMQSIAPISPN